MFPFAAGILFENDLDLPVARALAAETVTAPPFAPIPDEAFDRAAALLRQCQRVIVTRFPIAEGNERIRALIDEAQALGLTVETE